jgi:hypothetical protein
MSITRGTQAHAPWRHLRAWLVIGMACALAACGGGGGGGGGDNDPDTGTLAVTVTDEFDAPVQGASVEAVSGGTTRTGTTDADGEVTITGIPVGNANVEVSRDTFETATDTAAIQANQTTSLAVQLRRNTQAAGGVLTTALVSTADVGRVATIRLQVVVVNATSDAIENLTDADFTLPDCVLPSPDPNTFQSACVRDPTNAQTDIAYTVDNDIPANWDTVPGLPEEDYAAALMLDQSGSVNSTDPTGARLFSAKAFVQSVDAGSGDSVLLSAFADDNETQTALIPTKPLTVFDPFTTDGESYFDELDTLGDQAAGGTPLYRSLFPEAGDPENDPEFDTGLIDTVADSAPSGLNKAIVLFTDGEDSECGGPNVCRDKRQRVIDRANAAGVEIFTIGLSDEVDFEALGELANGANGVFLFAENAEQLIPLYGSLGALLSRSLLTYTMEFTVRAADQNTFVSGRSVLGRVHIDANGSPIEVPFIVGIP